MTHEEQGLLQNTLSQFTGTEEWYYLPMFRQYTYTEGVKYLAQTVDCYWLLTNIFAYQLKPKIKAEEFQVWILTVNDGTAVLKCEDGNGNVVFKVKIPFTDFPLPEIKFFFTNSVLMLPTEY